MVGQTWHGAPRPCILQSILPLRSLCLWDLCAFLSARKNGQAPGGLRREFGEQGVVLVVGGVGGPDLAGVEGGPAALEEGARGGRGGRRGGTRGDGGLSVRGDGVDQHLDRPADLGFGF